MQDHDNNSNKNRNVRRASGSGGGQGARTGGQPKPTGAPRSGSQPRRQAADSQTGANNQARPRRQAASDQPVTARQQKTGGQPRRQAPDDRSRAGGQSRPARAQGQPGPRGNAPGGQPKPKGQPRPNGRPQNTAGSKARKNPKNITPHQAAKKKRKKILLFVAEIFLLLILVAALWAVNKAQKIQIVEVDPINVYIDEEVQSKIEEGTSSMKGYRNIALFGVDSRNKQLNNNTRTDVIMIASINQDTKEVRLVSIYRDTWLNMTNDSYSKANAAYARGGAEQAIGMLNMNLDLDITDFVTVGFDAVIDVVDEIGGVEINVTQEEIVHLNSYQKAMVGRVVSRDENGLETYDATEGVDYIPVTHAGLQTLNGLQATAYCRIRYTSGGDGARTERQRTVLTQIAKKAMTMNPATLNKIVDSVFGEVATSLNMSEILELLSDIASYEIGETAGFPFTDHVKMDGWVGKASVVVPVDLEKNVTLLHGFLFDDSEYTPSATVKRCSEKIASDTGIRYNGE